MKKFSITMGLLIAAFAMAFMMGGCAGKDGVAGPAGADGKDASGTCKQCHANDQQIVAKEWQWSGTLHAIGESWEAEGSNPSCRRCHSGSGYVAFVNNDNISSYDSLNFTNANCRTCHNIHVAYDTTDWKLTNSAAIKLVIDTTVSVDLGKGNLCGTCHQSRTDPRKSVDSSGTLPANVKMSSRWGGHHGPQTNLLAAVGGWEGGDIATYPKDSGIMHKTAANNGCVGCHVSQENGQNHTFEPAVATCNNGIICHSAGPVTSFAAKQTAFVALMNQVRDTLVGRGALATATMDTAGASSAVKTAYVSALTSSYGVTIVAATVPRAVAGLAFNYMLCVEDKSLGIHNQKYEGFLLRSALKAVNSAIAPVN